MYLGSYLPLPPYRLGRGVDSKRLVHTHTHTSHPSLSPWGARESRPCPHPHNAHPNSGRRCFPIGPWFLALGPEPLFRRVVALLFAPSASGWLAGTLQHRRFLPKVRGRWGNSPLSPQWGRGGPATGGRGNPDLAPDPQIGGPGPRTKRRGRQGQQGQQDGGCPSGGHCQRAGWCPGFQGSVWLERNVIYGVTVARGQTHPWTSSRYKAFWAAWAFCTSHMRICVVCSLVHCKVTYGISCPPTQPLLLHFDNIINLASVYRVIV